MVLVFRLLPREVSSEVFAHLGPKDRNALIEALTDEETRYILAELDPDDRTDVLQELPGQVTQKLLNLLTPADLAEARHLLGYPEDSVGRLMTPDYVAVRPHWTVSEALEHIRRFGRDSETVSVVYVTDRSWRLLDALELGEIILAEPDARIEDLMTGSFVALSAFDDREEAVRVMQRYDVYALPVVDSEGTLVGMVTVDDVFDVAQEEATEDFHLVGAVSPLRVRYREAGVSFLFRRRVGWLVGLVFVNLISSGVIAAFEDTLSRAIALAFFIPLLIGSSGNAGAQSATMMVRALATGDIDPDQWRATVGKELVVGSLLGLTMGATSAVLGFIRGGTTVALIVAVTMFAVVVIGNTIGVILPFVLVRLRVDPAVASSPLIATLADATGLLVYFSVATWVFSALTAL